MRALAFLIVLFTIAILVYGRCPLYWFCNWVEPNSGMVYKSVPFGVKDNTVFALV